MTGSITGGQFPKDIYSLINEFHQDASSFKKQINIKVNKTLLIILGNQRKTKG